MKLRPWRYSSPCATSTSCRNRSATDLRENTRQRTSWARFTSVCFRMKSLMLPLSIHSDTKANLCACSVAPSNGRIFGCLRCLQTTASLQNLYGLLGQSRFLAGCVEWIPTLRSRLRSLDSQSRGTLIATNRPLYLSRYTSEKRPPHAGGMNKLSRHGIIIDLGRLRWRPHILHNRVRNSGRSLQDIMSVSNACIHRLARRV